MIYSEYNVSGGETTFPLDFPYISPTHVRVELDGVAIPFTIGSGSINIPGGVQSPGTLIIRRVTPIDNPMVEFLNGSVLTQEDLNTAVRQLLYAQQETSNAVNVRLPTGLNNTLRIPTTPGGIQPFTPVPAKALSFDADGQPVMVEFGGADAALRSDLATGGGSGLLTHNSGRAGEVPRSVRRTLSTSVSVLDFINPALWDSIEAGTYTGDLSYAFNAAIATGKRVNVPTGTYYCNLNIRANETFIAGELWRAARLRPYDRTLPVVRYDGVGKGDFIYFSQLENLEIYGFGTDPLTDSAGVEFLSSGIYNGSALASLRRVFIRNFAVGLKSTWTLLWSKFDEVRTQFCGVGWEFRGHNANALTFEDCYGNLNQQHGFTAHNDYTGPGGGDVHTFQNWVFNNCNFESNGQNTALLDARGISLMNCEQFAFRNLYLENNGAYLTNPSALGYGAFIGGDIGRNLSVEGVYAVGSHRPIWIEGTAKSGRISGVNGNAIPVHTNQPIVYVGGTWISGEPKFEIDSSSVVGGPVVVTADGNGNYNADSVDYIATPDATLSMQHRRDLTLNTATAWTIMSITGLLPGNQITLEANGANTVTLDGALMRDGAAHVIPSGACHRFSVRGYPTAGTLIRI